MAELERVLRAAREDERHAFVPYVTGGFPGVDASLLRDIEATGADAIEVGIPFSDPVMDGGVIQEASRVALGRGAHPPDVIATIGEADLSIPVAIMTYVNPVLRIGLERFVELCATAGVSGLIVPDLPVDEAADLAAVAAEHGIDLVLLAAPGTDPVRLARIGTESRGFVYCVATYGVTGARDELAGVARDLVGRLRPITDLPLLVGVGIGTPDQAIEACRFADGVVVGSAVMARLVARDRDGAVELLDGFVSAVHRG